MPKPVQNLSVYKQPELERGMFVECSIGINDSRVGYLIRKYDKSRWVVEFENGESQLVYSRLITWAPTRSQITEQTDRIKAAHLKYMEEKG